MTSGNKEEQTLDRLLARLHSGELTDAEHHQLETRLLESPEARRAWRLQNEIHALLDGDEQIHALLAGLETPSNVVTMPGVSAATATATVAAGASLKKDTAPETETEEAADAEKNPARLKARWLAWAAIATFAALVLFTLMGRGGSSSGVEGEEDSPGGNLAAGAPAKAPEEEKSGKEERTPVPEALEVPQQVAEVEEVSTTPAPESPQHEEATPDSTALAENPEPSPAQPSPTLVSLEETPEQEYQRMLLADVPSGSQNRPPTKFVALGSDGKVQFNRDIRPILSDNCFYCHGPDSGHREAGLRLDVEEAVFTPRDGEPAVVIRGKPEESALFQRIVHEDPDERMPPLDSHKTITPEQIALLRQWIAEGAEWEAHWAFIAPEYPEIPAAASEWPYNEIDQFVLARLAQEGIQPATQADPYTLLRRVTLDLTGLPPTVEEIEAFAADPSFQAYEKVVDRLLKSEAYGEHRARFWLDAARYGDTHGLHLDNRRVMWPYRDWVIQAYNDNVPFDRFTREQIAGDLMPDPTQAQLVATGFNRCNVTTSEGGAIDEEFLARYAVDRVETTATVWLGLTAGCASCHNHKFDPLTMKDFYRLYAYFNNTTQRAMDQNIPDTPPVIRVYPKPETEQREKELSAKVKALDGQLAALKKEHQAGFEAWLADPDSQKTVKTLSHPDLTYSTSIGREQADVPEEPVPALSKDEPFSIVLRFRAPEKMPERLELFSATDGSPQQRGYRVVFNDMDGIALEMVEAWPSKVMRIMTIRRIKPGGIYHLAFTYDGSGTEEGLNIFLNGELLASRYPLERMGLLNGDFKTQATLKVNTAAKDESGRISLQEIEIYHRDLLPEEVGSLQESGKIPGLLAKAAKLEAAKKAKDKADPKQKDAGKLDGKELELLKEFYFQKTQPDYQGLLAEKIQVARELDAIHRAAPTTLVMQDNPDQEARAFVLERGEYDKPGEEVSPGTPDFLPPQQDGQPQNRLGLANWLVDTKNPLVARVTVNRMWQELFGVGLVKTAEDFGTQGEPPSHPELLDWLALRFIDSGWDMKAMYRMMVLSSTYRQSSQFRPELKGLNAENRLLARGPRYRLDAEMLRDQALAASGLLVRTVGGESVRPYQPSGIWEAVGYTNSNTQTFFQDHGEDEVRRSVYTFWKRTAPPPDMVIFDAPNRESCTVRRERTNTPLQALVLMNDPQFVRAARSLALQVMNEADSDEARIHEMGLLLLGRPFEADEVDVVMRSLTAFKSEYDSDHAEAARLVDDMLTPQKETHPAPGEFASWIMVANQLMNLDEAINKN